MSTPSIGTIKQLFAVSGNRCAFPGCKEALVRDGILIGEVCHIRAARQGGPRFAPDQKNNARNQFENLIILCPTHHKLIDSDVKTYTTEYLIAIKRKHESSFGKTNFVISNRIAYSAAFSAGAGLGITVGDQIRDLITEIIDVVRLAKRTRVNLVDTLKAELLVRLRLIGPGGMLVGIKGPNVRPIGLFIMMLFKEAGWKVLEGNSSQVPGQSGLVVICAIDGLDGPDALLAIEPRRTLGILLSRLGFQAINPTSVPSGMFRDENGSIVILLHAEASTLKHCQW